MPKAPRKKLIRLAREKTASSTLKKAENRQENGNVDSKSTIVDNKKVREKEVEILTSLSTPTSSSQLPSHLETLVSLASILVACEPSILKLLLGKNLIGILIDKLKENVNCFISLRDQLGNSNVSMKEFRNRKEEMEMRREAWGECLGCLNNLNLNSTLPNSSGSLLPEMHNKGLLPIFLSLIDVYRIALASDEKLEEDWGFENWLELGAGLSSFSPKSLPSLSSSTPLAQFLLSTLLSSSSSAPSPSSLSRQIGISQLIYSLTGHDEDISKPFIEKLLALEQGDSLVSMLEKGIRSTQSRTSDENVLRILFVGIYENISPYLLEPNSSARASSIESLLTFIEKFGGDLNADAASAISIWEELSQQPSPNPLKPPTATQTKMRDLERKLENLEFSLKVLASVVAGFGDFEAEEEPEKNDEDGMDEDENEKEDEADDFEMKVENNGIHNDVKMDGVEENHSFLSSIFQRLSSILLSLSTPTDLSFAKVDSNPKISSRPNIISTSTNGSSPAVRAPPSIVELISSINLTSLEVLSDFLLISLDEKANSFPKKTIQLLWEGILEKISGVKEKMNLDKLSVESNSGEHDKKSKKLKGKGKGKEVEAEDEEMEEMKLDFVDVGLKAVWSLARSGMGDLRIGDREVPFLEEVCNEIRQDRIQISCIGIMGCLAEREGVSIPVNEAIGVYLMSLISSLLSSPTCGLETLLQCFDSVFDIYADETRDYDTPVFRNKGFLGVLKKVHPELKKRVKSIDKRKESQLRQRAEGVLINLNAFISYRKEFE